MSYAVRPGGAAGIGGRGHGLDHDALALTAADALPGRSAERRHKVGLGSIEADQVVQMALVGEACRAQSGEHVGRAEM